MTECIVCQQMTSKYKCPKCLEVYCSLECYKQHKESPKCLEKLKDKTVDDKEQDCNDIEPTVHEPFKTEDTVTLDKLKELGDNIKLIFLRCFLRLFAALSDDLKNLLYNPHLRNLLQEIDTASSAWKAMKAAMHEPLFLEFADVCLKIIEPSTEDNDNMS